MSKEPISQSIKRRLFSLYHGRQHREGKCFVCTRVITIENFQAAHVIPEKFDGELDYYNLRPTCEYCNKSMGTRYLYEYMLTECKRSGAHPEDEVYNLLAQALHLLNDLALRKIKGLNKQEGEKLKRKWGPRADIRVRIKEYRKLLLRKKKKTNNTGAKLTPPKR